MFKKSLTIAALLLLSIHAKAAVVLDGGYIEYDDGSYINVTFDSSTQFTAGIYTLDLTDVFGVIVGADIITQNIALLPDSPMAGDFLSLTFEVDGGDNVFLNELILSDFTTYPTVGSRFYEDRVEHGVCTDIPVACADPAVPFDFDLGESLTTNMYLEYTPVAPVPLPAAAWLFISALGALGVAKRKRAA